jgi:hypothetical protein
MRSRLIPILLAASVVPAWGCGTPNIAPVRGRVTCNGKPVPDAALIFSPVPKNENDRESGKAAAAGTDADGYFVLSTFKERDGALIGKHRVSITIDENAKIPCKSKVIEVEIKPGDNEVNIELDPKGPPKQKDPR